MTKTSIDQRQVPKSPKLIGMHSQLNKHFVEKAQKVFTTKSSLGKYSTTFGAKSSMLPPKLSESRSNHASRSRGNSISKQFVSASRDENAACEAVLFKGLERGGSCYLKQGVLIPSTTNVLF